MLLLSPAGDPAGAELWQWQPRRKKLAQLEPLSGQYVSCRCSGHSPARLAQNSETRGCSALEQMSAFAEGVRTQAAPDLAALAASSRPSLALTASPHSFSSR